MVKIGDKIPNITLIDQDNNSVKLNDFIGKKMIVYFYPRDNTPGCTKECISFRDEYPTFKGKDILVFGVSNDSTNSHIKFRNKLRLQFPLLSDPESKLIKAFGSYGKTRSGKMSTIRSTFLIDEKGTVTAIWGLKGYPKVNTAKHASEVIETLEKL